MIVDLASKGSQVDMLCIYVLLKIVFILAVENLNQISDILTATKFGVKIKLLIHWYQVYPFLQDPGHIF